MSKKRFYQNLQQPYHLLGIALAALWLMTPLAAFATIPASVHPSEAIRPSSWGQTAVATEYLQQHRPTLALTHLKAAVAEDPKHLVAHYLIATTADDLAQNQAIPVESRVIYQRQANAAFEKTVLLNPKILSATLRLGKMAMEKKDYRAAERYYQNALDVMPDSAVLHFNLANVYDEQQYLTKAITEYEATIALDNRFVYAYNNVGLLYGELDQSEKAINAFKKAIALDNDYVFAKLNLGQLYTKTKQFALAEQTFKAALQDEPENPWANLYLGNLYMQTGKYEAATAAYKTAISQQPAFAPTYYLLASVLEKLNRWEESQRYGEQYLELDPQGGFANHARNLVNHTRLQQVQPVAAKPTCTEDNNTVKVCGYVSTP